MHWPVKLLINKKTTGFARGLDHIPGSYEYHLWWQSAKPIGQYERDENGQKTWKLIYPVAGVQVLINRRLALALRHVWSTPRLALRDLKHRFYYGRLDYQYECGLADGRREVLENPETYKDLTPQEFQAAIARPEHQ